MAKKQKEPKYILDRTDSKYVEKMPPCYYCKHLLQTGAQFSAERWTCKAFPAGIPEPVWGGTMNHNWNLPGQQGSYRYESVTVDHGEGPEKITYEGEWIPA